MAGDFKGFQIGAGLSFSKGTEGYNVKATGSLMTPEGIGFEAYLAIVNGRLKDISLGISGRVAVGSTGLFITWVDGSLTNLDSSDPTITAAVTLVYGDANILRMTGAVEINRGTLEANCRPEQPAGDLHQWHRQCGKPPAGRLHPRRGRRPVRRERQPRLGKRGLHGPRLRQSPRRPGDVDADIGLTSRRRPVLLGRRRDRGSRRTSP